MTMPLATPSLIIDGAVVRRNIGRLASYGREHGIGIRPHTKTHKSVKLAAMQLDAGAVGLTIAKVGEAETMAQVGDDLLLAYPAVDRARCDRLANLAKSKTVHVAIDSTVAADALADAARRADAVIGILVDIDVGYGRTGLQSPADALALAQHVDCAAGLRVDGIMVYPGHVWADADGQRAALEAVDAVIAETLDLWRQSGLNAAIVSGGSTPTAYQSHAITNLTEIRPGTYVFNDMNTVRGGYCQLDDCAARFTCTVVSDAVPNQVVIDAGSKTLTSDRCVAGEQFGYGYIVEYPDATITKLSEEHGQVDVGRCDARPQVGQRVTVIPNHICPCVNLQDRLWWRESGEEALAAVPVDARGMLS